MKINRGLIWCELLFLDVFYLLPFQCLQHASPFPTSYKYGKRVLRLESRILRLCWNLHNSVRNLPTTGLSSLYKKRWGLCLIPMQRQNRSSTGDFRRHTNLPFLLSWERGYQTSTLLLDLRNWPKLLNHAWYVVFVWTREAGGLALTLCSYLVWFCRCRSTRNRTNKDEPSCSHQRFCI